MDTLAGVHDLAALGAALSYPKVGFRDALRDLGCELQKKDAGASRAIGAFLDATADCTQSSHAETYTRTFDLSPQCAPYLGVHLFGEQDARRNQLMIGLAEEYARCGYAPDGELPDHLAVVLQALERLPAEPRRELVDLCLAPAVTSMLKMLESTGNPYGHLVRAVSLLMRSGPSAQVAIEAGHA